MESDELCARWSAAVDALNNDDLSAFRRVLAERCVWEHVGTSADEILERLRLDRSQGWLRHGIVSVSAAGSLLATVARNTYADGSSHHVAGVAHFDVDGRIDRITALDEVSLALAS